MNYIWIVSTLDAVACVTVLITLMRCDHDKCACGERYSFNEPLKMYNKTTIYKNYIFVTYNMNYGALLLLLKYF